MHFFPAVSSVDHTNCTVIKIFWNKLSRSEPVLYVVQVFHTVFFIVEEQTQQQNELTAQQEVDTTPQYTQSTRRCTKCKEPMNDTHVVDALILCHEYARVVVRSCLEPVWNRDVRHLLPSTSLGDHFGQVIVPSKPLLPGYRLPGCSCSGDDYDKHGVYCWSKYRFDLCNI